MLAWLKQQDGQMLAFAALGTAVLILCAALAIDVSYMHTARNQLQIAVDASAMAGASGLTVDQSTAVSRAVSLSNANTIMQNPLSLQSNEIVFPNYKTITVTAQRTIPLFFTGIMGLNSLTLSATATAQCGNRDIMLVFDRSGSMDDDTDESEEIIIPQPITTAKDAAYYLIDQIAANNMAVDRIGLVSYSDYATLNRVLDRQFALMKTTVAGYVANGNTNIGDGIYKATNHLNANSPSNTKKTIILFSDGMANRPGTGMPTNQTAINYAISKTNAAKSSNVKIYTISLGSDTDPTLMAYIANATGGKYYYAPSASDLYAIYLDIAKRIPVRLVG